MAGNNIKIYKFILKLIFLQNFLILIVGSDKGVIIKKDVNINNDVIFKKQIDNLKQLKRVDIVFLIDGSSSVGSTNFECELLFVKKLLSDFTVAENRTKVSLVVFGSNAIVYEHSDKCELLNFILPLINYPGTNTNTLGAFLAAKELLLAGRKNAHKVIFLVTDGFSNGRSPIPIAEDLKSNYNTTIFTLGIVNGNRKELEQLRSQENTSYFLKSFDKFDLLARKALHTDLKEGDYIRLEDEKCGGCDPLAICTCGTTSGHYSCKCRPGYYGTGKKDDCTPCPKGSWHDSLSGICLPCPDYNHFTNESDPATSIDDCRCKIGYKKPAKDPYKCEVMRCPKLKPPENGYFVGKTNCPNVLNSACGVRCNVGYSLRGTSIRICRENGQWDGLEPQCHLKTCPRPPIPVGGEVFCNNTDLDISFNTLPDEMPVDTECIFNCQPGSNLIGSTKRTCLPIEQWDGLKTTCKPIRCIKISRVPNGKVYPPECSREKQKHKDKCDIICADGFSGPGEIECISRGRHGAWSAKPRCFDITPPKITCPKNIETVAIFGENFGLVQWDDPEILENSNSHVNVWWEPILEEENETGPYKFEIGETTIFYYAVDQSGNGAKCNFTVTVLDLEPPIFEDCSNPPPYLIGEEGIIVEWDEPHVTDNSGNEITVHKSKEFGPLPIGTTPIEYTAVDLFNNTNTCIINITVSKTSCEDQLPKGLENCNNLPNGLLCVLTCQEGYAFSMSDKATCESQYANWIIPECTPTEIPKEISGEIEKDCLELKTTCTGDDCELLECEEDYRVKREVESRERSSIQNKKFETFKLDKSTKLYNWHHDQSIGTAFKTENIDGRLGTVEENFKILNWQHDQSPRFRRQIENKRRRSKFRVKINKNIDLEQKFKGIVPETLRFHCKNGSIPLKSKKFRCVKCPKGFFHNVTSKTCDPCPLNHYNDKIGATECLECPLGTLTRGRKGSKGLKACKIHLGGKFRSLVRKKSCNNSTCVHGKCIPVGLTRHRCLCESDWVGVRCRIRKVDHCALEPCLNGGTCSLVVQNLTGNTTQGYSCVCPVGFIGEFCELEELLDDPPLPKVNICKQVANLCENGGVCQPDKRLRGDYKCICPPGFLGKRCQNVPCDYRPCPDNNICVNVLEDGRDTTRKSFKCNCPEGKTNPPKCLVDLPLLDNCGGCQNNGTCLPNGQCVCPIGYLGTQCQEKASEHFILEFSTSGMSDFALLKAPEANLTEFTFCSWLQTNNTFNYGTILSYATSEMDNTLTLIDYAGLVLWINGKYAVTNIKINDGTWHHVCISWKAATGSFSIFVDSIKKATGSGLSVEKPIKGSGTFVLGQDQDFPGGGFSNIESFVGKMAHLDIWNKILDEEEMQHKCGEYQGGNFVAWKDFRSGVQGKTKILESDFCGGCKVPSSNVTGGRWEVGGNGSNLTLACQRGYVIHLNGNPHAMTSLTRHCLASGRWQDEMMPVSCAKVYCAPPPRIRHARITNRRRLWRYGDVVNYQCIGGTKSHGQHWKTCGEGGRWTNETFECVGASCEAFVVPKEANLTIVSEHVYDEDFEVMRSFDIGTSIEVNCLNQTVIVTCLENQTWDQELPNCQETLLPEQNKTLEGSLMIPEGNVDKDQESTTQAITNGSSTTTSSSDEVTTSRSTLSHQNFKEPNTNPPKVEQSTKKPEVTSPKPISTSEHILGPKPTTIEKTIQTSLKPIGTTPTSKRPILNKVQTGHPKKEESFTGLRLFEKKLKKIKGQMGVTEDKSGANLPETKVEDKERTIKNATEMEKDASSIPKPDKNLQESGLDASKVDKNGTSTSKVDTPRLDASKVDINGADASKVDKNGSDASKMDTGSEPKLTEVVSKEVQTIKNASKVDVLDESLHGNQFSSIGNGSNPDPDIKMTSGVNISNFTDPKMDQTQMETTTSDPNTIGIGCEGFYAPSVPDNGYLVDANFNNFTLYEVGTIVSYKCRSGYDLIGMNFTICLIDGRWSNPEISCKPVKCPYPPKYSNMYPKRQLGLMSFHFGNMVNYECDLGFTFYGNNVIRCQANGRWSRMKGKCARISCGKPSLPSSEIILGSSYLYKDSLLIMCPAGSAINQYEAKCMHSGQWLFIGNCHTPASRKNNEDT